ncbi:hypothetical protein K505DRAFT_371912 [Melanomma pulvis-pyrius CBS 109.77]|uniref:Peptidase M43 pregnancy-associated plasma-A domain-containing protein n=1 Tax=Melanomma pulvis-pyrius CBS 109.77 TaxID=1314802 RepID=A0A6A6XPB5_9PLEO|nr:hypothetical protein K505DRAFT_371912 [Melanomma pulvis-pyrius CBS 109.77]
MQSLLTFITLLSLVTAHAIPSDLHTRQASSVTDGSWLITWTPSAPNSQVYKGPLRVTSNSSGTYISGDLYNGTVLPNPADGSPVLPRANYWAYVRPTKLTPGSNGGFSLALEYWQLLGFRRTVRGNATIWGDAPFADGLTVDLAPTTAPTGFPDPSNYFSGDLKFAGNGSSAGTFTMGWVSTFLRRIELEIGTVTGVPVPLEDTTETRTWTSIFAEVGYDINVSIGKTDIPEPTNPDLPPGMWKNEQEHAAVLAYRAPTDFDKQWKYYLLVTRLLEGTPRGSMIDESGIYNGVPREGTAIAAEWIVGTTWDGKNDTALPWPAAVRGKKFDELTDPYFRTAVHEVGHMFNLVHPDEFRNDIMTDTETFVQVCESGGGSGGKGFPECIDAGSMAFREHDRFYMQHRPDTHVRPGFVNFGFSAQEFTPPMNGPL